MRQTRRCRFSATYPRPGQLQLCHASTSSGKSRAWCRPGSTFSSLNNNEGACVAEFINRVSTAQHLDRPASRCHGQQSDFLAIQFVFTCICSSALSRVARSAMAKLPNGLISFGKNANCTLALCPIEASILQYQPSIPGNGVIIGLFALSMLIHIVQGLRWRSWDFMICMVLGSVDEIIGYIGRIMLHSNPFSFNAFVIQIGSFTPTLLAPPPLTAPT